MCGLGEERFSVIQMCSEQGCKVHSKSFRDEYESYGRKITDEKRKQRKLDMSSTKPHTREWTESPKPTTMCVGLEYLLQSTH
jgi:hypothetical protein